MNDALRFAIGWALPLFLGVGVWQLITGWPHRVSSWLAALGYGYLLGLALCAASTALFASAHTDEALTRLSPWLGGIAVLMWILAWIFGRGVEDVPTPSINPAKSAWLRYVAIVLIALLIWRAWLLFDEVTLLQTFPWDAWSAWAVKAKTWYLLGHVAPFVSMPTWLASNDATMYTNAAWNYPPLLPWIEVWCANAANGWNEPLINLAWWGLWIALLLACYGQLRALGLGMCYAIFAVYALGSLPLLETHIALAGYADVWIAATFAMCVLCWLRGVQRNARRQWIAGLLLSLLLPMIKLEGGVWLCCFWCAIALGLNRSVRLGFGVLMIGLFLFVALFGGLHVPLPGMGVVDINFQQIHIPGKGDFHLQWRWVGMEVAQGLFALPNWHLLWFVLPLAMILRWRVVRDSIEVRALGCLLFLCALFLCFLFFFTDAAQWAKDYTSLNRLILQIAPLVVVFIALLFREDITRFKWKRKSTVTAE